MTDQPTDSQEIPVASTHETYEAAEPPDAWFEEPEELPRRPRGRLLAPLPIALLCVLLTACGFIGGVLVEKGQAGSGAAGGSGLAGRFAALRSAAGTPAAGAGATGAAARSALGTGAGGGGGGATIGQVAFVQGSTLYVTDSSGNTVKVKTSAASTVTKTVSGSVHAIRPGEQVVVSGTTASNGTVTAESIRVGGSAAGGLAGLFGGGGASPGSGTGTGSSTTNGSSSGGPALFGGG